MFIQPEESVFYNLKNYTEALWNVEKALEMEPDLEFMQQIKTELLEILRNKG